MKKEGILGLFVSVAIILTLTAIMVRPVSSCPPGNIQISKVDEDNYLLGGAIFKVTPNPYGGTYLLVTDNGTRDNDNRPGVIMLTKVPVASYKITENIAPPSYKLDNTIQTAVVKSSLTTTLKFTDRRGSVPISISPTYENGPNGAVLVYIVTVTNTYHVTTTYALTVTDNAGWLENILPASLTIPPLSNGTATLGVKIPDNTLGGSVDNLTVTATKAGLSGSGRCTGQVTINRPANVPVSISPSSQGGLNGALLIYIVTITNNGNVTDTYSLTTADNSGWLENISPMSITIPAFSSGTATLSVMVPSNATGGTLDNVSVTATGTGVSGSGSCTAHATIDVGVSVLISPCYQDALNGDIADYSVILVNIGNATDIFDLKITDNSGWDIWLEDNSLLVYGFDNENTTTLHVKVPGNAIMGTEDNIIVTAISRTDNTIEGERSCTAHTIAMVMVDVAVSPPLDNGLYKDVVVTNMGNIVDSYDLTLGENVSWPLVLAENCVDNLMPGENCVIPLGITIPAYTTSGTLGEITVTATSKVYLTVKDKASAQVTSIKGVEVSISPSENYGNHGDRLLYTVTVKNIGNTWDNYCLNKADVLGWTYAEDFAWLPLAPSDNATVIFDVFVPEMVEPHSVDNITVTATSTTESQINDNAIGKAFGPNLLVGWNLVCFTGAGVTDAPTSLFSDMNYLTDYVIYWWEAPGGPYHLQGSAEIFKDNLGYWVSTNKDEAYRTTGVEPASRDIKLIHGWNLVGFPVTNQNTTPNNIFTGLNYLTDYFVYHWAAPTGPYVLMGSSEVFENFLGYWVWANSAMTVTAP